MIGRNKVILALALLLILSCKKGEKEKYDWIPLKVTVSAYNSHASQTDGHPNIAAWGDTLIPGMKSIAVSRDLISKGLRYNTMVKIEGLEGIYLVKDKMHFRWRNRIDIYMGNDVSLANEWGKKKLEIQYAVKKDSIRTRTSLN